MKTPTISTLLPKDAREALIAASAIRDTRERARAIQAAIERAQRRYPQHFKLTQGAMQ